MMESIEFEFTAEQWDEFLLAKVIPIIKAKPNEQIIIHKIEDRIIYYERIELKG